MHLRSIITLIVGLIAILGLSLWLIDSLSRLYWQLSYSPLLGNLLLLLLVLLIFALIAAFVYYFLKIQSGEKKKRRTTRRVITPEQIPAQKADAASSTLQAVKQQVAQIQDEVTRQALLSRSREIETNLTRGEIQVVVFGTGSAGKTSLVNAVMGRMVGNVDAPMGTTQVGETYCLRLKGLERKILITDTPGILEAGFAGTERGIYYSANDGETWQKVAGIPEFIPISSITIDPKRPQNVYVGTAQTFYLSRDGGRVWTRRGGNLPLGNYASILINPNNSDEIYTASSLESDGGIFFSKNAGMNWTRIDKKELKLPSHRVWAMAFDPNDSNRIFAGTHSSGVYLIERAIISNAADNKTPGKSTTGN